MTLAILYNGPPSCGKDAIGRRVAAALGWPVLQFKDKLYLDTAKHFEVEPEWFITAHNVGDKSAPRPELDNLSTRDALIHVSERVIKPIHGKDYFGVAAAVKMATMSNVGFVFTDSGFLEELIPVRKMVDDLIVIQLYREGCPFIWLAGNFNLAAVLLHQSFADSQAKADSLWFSGEERLKYLFQVLFRYATAGIREPGPDKAVI